MARNDEERAVIAIKHAQITETIMIPRSLYIHIPWCIRKCPYCDFNSHKSPDSLPEADYVKALIRDFERDLAEFPATQLTSIFIGGGTPSLLAASYYDTLLNQIQHWIPFADDIEITLEANPGTVEQQRFNDYRAIGINRLSLGIQSFNAAHLKALGRIHDDSQAHQAIHCARRAGFDNLNLDIMHGLPHQTVGEGLADLYTAMQYNPEHVSWYQLTIEPNTVFYKQQPSLPDEEDLECLESKGLAILTDGDYQRYEISAFSLPNQAAKHNMNYWLFGDYYGIGAGAHGKLSTGQTGDELRVYRTEKKKQPSAYLSAKPDELRTVKTVSAADLVFEFMLNASRLQAAIPLSLFQERTGLDFRQLERGLRVAEERGLIALNEVSWRVTDLGRRYTNDLQSLFLYL